MNWKPPTSPEEDDIWQTALMLRQLYDLEAQVKRGQVWLDFKHRNLFLAYEIHNPYDSGYVSERMLKAHGIELCVIDPRAWRENRFRVLMMMAENADAARIGAAIPHRFILREFRTRKSGGHAAQEAS